MKIMEHNGVYYRVTEEHEEPLLSDIVLWAGKEYSDTQWVTLGYIHNKDNPVVRNSCFSYLRRIDPLIAAMLMALEEHA